MYNFHNGLLPELFNPFFMDIHHTHGTRLASTSSYYIPNIRTNYGKFNIRYSGPKIWNSISESTKKQTKFSFIADIKNDIFQQYLNIN